MALAGMDALRVLRQIRRDDDQIRRQFLFRNHVLNEFGPNSIFPEPTFAIICWNRSRSGPKHFVKVWNKSSGKCNRRWRPTGQLGPRSSHAIRK